MEIVLGEPACRRDRRRDLALVERVRPLRRDPLAAWRRARAARSARPTAGAGHGARAARAHLSAIRAVQTMPSRAASAAGATALSRPKRPKREARSAQSRTAPGTVTDRGPTSSADRPPRSAGDRPEPLNPYSAPSSQTSANASPPMPLSVGSATVSIAAAASAASTAFPPRSSALRPARVASGWLVATIASALIAGIRRQPLDSARPGWKRASRSSSTIASIAGRRASEACSAIKPLHSCHVTGGAPVRRRRDAARARRPRRRLRGGAQLAGARDRRLRARRPGARPPAAPRRGRGVRRARGQRRARGGGHRDAADGGHGALRRRRAPSTGSRRTSSWRCSSSSTARIRAERWSATDCGTRRTAS